VREPGRFVPLCFQTARRPVPKNGIAHQPQHVSYYRQRTILIPASADAWAASASTRTMSEKLLSNVSTKSQVSMGRGDHFCKKYFEDVGNADTAGSRPKRLR